MKEINVSESGRSYTIEVGMQQSTTNGENVAVRDFVCDVIDEWGRPILEYRVPSNHEPYFARSYNCSIPEFLKSAAEMFIGFHEQKISLGLVK